MNQTVEDSANLRAELHRIRQQSLAAARQNDFRMVARLTAEAARINRVIHCQEEFANFSPKSLAVVDALSNLDDAGHFSFPAESSTSIRVADGSEICSKAA